MYKLSIGSGTKDSDISNYYRHPNLIELRFMMYAGIVKGCSGTFYFSFQSLPREPEYLTEYIKPVVDELRNIREFLKWESFPCPSISGNVDSRLLTLCRKRYGTVFILIVNASMDDSVIPEALWPYMAVENGTSLTLRPWEARWSTYNNER